MTRAQLAALLVREATTEIETAIRILWFFQRVEGVSPVLASSVVDFFGEHAISTPKKSRLQKKLFADRRVLRGPQQGYVRLRAAELERLDATMGVVPPGSDGDVTDMRPPDRKIFIGHGSSPAWRELKDFVHERLGLPWDEFNRLPVAGVSNVARLGEMLDEAAMAFLVLTAEDEVADGSVRARENVVHEAGLFQGRLGFSKAIILLEDGCSEFSNIRGLGQIRFPTGKISAAFEEIRKVVEREIGVVKSPRGARTK